MRLGDLSDGVYAALVEAAEADRQSLSAFVVDRLTEVARVASLGDYVAAYVPPTESGIGVDDTVAAVREVRDARPVQANPGAQGSGAGRVASPRRLSDPPHGARTADATQVGLRDNVTAYAAAYVALAEHLDAHLATSDGKLAAADGPRRQVELIA
ncbi:MAG: hypothetical protein ACRCSN_06110 [Dermatophilaceae bacterium]